jgi:hypothetical protein
MCSVAPPSVLQRLHILITVQTLQLAQSVLLLTLLCAQVLWGQGTQYPAFCAEDLAAQQSDATAGAGATVKGTGKKRKGSGSSTTTKSKKSTPVKKRSKNSTNHDQWKQMCSAGKERTDVSADADSNASVAAGAAASDDSGSDEDSDTELHPDSNKARERRCFLEVMKASQVSCCSTAACMSTQ